MAGHCTRGLYFHSPSARENMTHPLVQYPAILHSKPLNNIYVLGYSGGSKGGHCHP